MAISPDKVGVYDMPCFWKSDLKLLSGEVEDVTIPFALQEMIKDRRSRIFPSCEDFFFEVEKPSNTSTQ
jgi:hypothetical protein